MNTTSPRVKAPSPNGVGAKSQTTEEGQDALRTYGGGQRGAQHGGRGEQGVHASPRILAEPFRLLVVYPV